MSSIAKEYRDVLVSGLTIDFAVWFAGNEVIAEPGNAKFDLGVFASIITKAIIVMRRPSKPTAGDLFWIGVGGALYVPISFAIVSFLSRWWK